MRLDRGQRDTYLKQCSSGGSVCSESEWAEREWLATIQLWGVRATTKMNLAAKIIKKKTVMIQDEITNTKCNILNEI